MEVLAVIALVGNVIQFVDLAGKLISKSTHLYKSARGALAENIDVETVTSDLVVLSNSLKDSASNPYDEAFRSISESCHTVAEELLNALDKVKAKGKHRRLESIRKAVRSVWDKEYIEGLERRLARFREELNLRVVVDLRVQLTQFKFEHSDRFEKLDTTGKKIIDAIVMQQDVFQAVYDVQFTLINTLHGDTVTKISDEHEITRREIIEEIRRSSLHPSTTYQTISFTKNTNPSRQDGIEFVYSNLSMHQLKQVHQTKTKSVIEAGTGKTMRLLSLDNGGIRGLSSLFILEHMMQKVKRIEGLDSEPLPSDYFDMMCGTGTGGIIAIMLGRLRMSVSECIADYLWLSKKVFGQVEGLAHQESFNSVVLEEVIKAIVKKKTGDQNAPFFDSSCCKTFVCASKSKTLGESPVLLCTYRTSLDVINCTIWEAARATSAVPKLLPPVRFGKHGSGDFLHGGVGHNNPSKLLVEEAHSYYRLKGYIKTRPTCLVSIGTGQKDLVQLHKAATLFWFRDQRGSSLASVLGGIVTDCENTHDEMILSCLEYGAPYYRFNVPKEIQNPVLDEWAKADDIKTYTNKYMQLKRTEHELLECVKGLSSESDVPREPDITVIPDEPGTFHIQQEGSEFRGHNVTTAGSIFQGNFVSF